MNNIDNLKSLDFAKELLEIAQLYAEGKEINDWQYQIFMLILGVLKGEIMCRNINTLNANTFNTFIENNIPS